jgi:hypothetical protein
MERRRDAIDYILEAQDKLGVCDRGAARCGQSGGRGGGYLDGDDVIFDRCAAM